MLESSLCPVHIDASMDLLQHCRSSGSTGTAMHVSHCVTESVVRESQCIVSNGVQTSKKQEHQSEGRYALSYTLTLTPLHRKDKVSRNKLCPGLSRFWGFSMKLHAGKGFEKSSLSVVTLHEKTASDQWPLIFLKILNGIWGPDMRLRASLSALNSRFRLHQVSVGVSIFHQTRIEQEKTEFVCSEECKPGRCKLEWKWNFTAARHVSPIMFFVKISPVVGYFP